MTTVPEYPPGRALLEGRVVVVTAAAGAGIGFAAAKRCVEEGATVVVSDVHERRLGEAADALGELAGERPLGVRCDVTVEDDVQGLFDAAVDALLLVMAPAAPHLCAELWEARNGGHVHEQPWPEADPAKLVDDTVTMVVQVNGKVRDRLEVPADLDESGAEAAALASDKVAALLDGAVPRKVIARPPKLVNLVV